MKKRIIEVALWLKNICAVLAVVFAVAVTTFIAVEEGADDGFAATLISIAIGVSVCGVAWVINYVITARKFGAVETVHLIFGNVPPTFWFILFFMYFWGVGTAIWSGVSDTALFGNEVAEGVGSASVILLVGAIGRLYRPNKFMGHVVGTFIMSIVVLFTFYHMSSLKPTDTQISKHYDDGMYMLLSMDFSDKPDVALRLLMNTDFRDAVVAADRCENRFDVSGGLLNATLSGFAFDLVKLNYGQLASRYGKEVADNRHIIQQNYQELQNKGVC